jgi:hypothetical protein
VIWLHSAARLLNSRSWVDINPSEGVWVRVRTIALLPSSLSRLLVPLSIWGLFRYGGESNDLVKVTVTINLFRV